MIAEVNRNPKRRPEPFGQRDFMPRRRGGAEPEPPEMTEQETLDYMVALNTALGGKDLRVLQGGLSDKHSAPERRVPEPVGA